MTPPSFPSNPPRRPSAVDRLAEEYLDAAADLDPIFAGFAGLSGYDDRLTDYSPQAHAARADLARTTLARLAGRADRADRADRAGRADQTDRASAEDEVDEVTVAALTERLTHAVEVAEAGLDLADLNNIASPVQSVREIFDLAPTADVDDWEAIAARLRAVPTALAGYRASLEQARVRGWVPAVRQVRAVGRQAVEFSAADGFFTRLVTGARLADGRSLDEAASARLVADLAAGATDAAAAYADLDRWLRTDLEPVARADDAVGPEIYAVAARGFLGTTIDPDDTYAWAVDELARIEARAARVAAQVLRAAGEPAPGSAGGAGGSGGAGRSGGAGGSAGADRRTVDAAIEVLNGDTNRILHGTDALVGWMQRLSDDAVSALSGTHFDIPEPLRRLECRIAPSTAGGIYYTGPSEDLSRPGRMWWSVPAETTSFSTWRETTTVYHEGVPGHHLQIGRTVTLSDTLNRWRRLGCWISGHGEGWALYAERLMEELGFLDDPGALLGMLDAQALRACRVIVDIGVHRRMPAPPEVGGGTWDAEAAWRFLTAHTRLPEPSRRFELERYLGWPGQAISYKVGERTWLDLRETASRGPGFDLRTFHSRALELGSVGLDVLRDALTGSSGPTATLPT